MKPRKNSIIAVLLLLLAVLPMTALAGERKDITPQEAQQLLQTEDIFLLDVRTPWEYRRGAIKGAHLIPIYRFREHEKEIPTDKPVLVYCAVGGRSLPVADYLAKKGVTTYNLRDGLVAWQRQGLPLVTPNSNETDSSVPERNYDIFCIVETAS